MLTWLKNISIPNEAQQRTQRLVWLDNEIEECGRLSRYYANEKAKMIIERDALLREPIK